MSAGADFTVVTWEPGGVDLGRAVVAIGVFDGVHAGHQVLLGAVAAEARVRNATSVAITFDRDPDQVITPEAASPQLLTLQDKLRFIAACDIDAVLVVPFDESAATMPAEEFLDAVVGGCCEVHSVHVGSDFRFGARAAGDGATLAAWCQARGARYASHGLFSLGDGPVTSTRIRRLVAAGDVAGAAALLTRPTRLAGTVRVGRGEGRKLGFPTANVVPVPFAALPGDGVYGGRAILADGTLVPAAISIGVPPTYPEARDYVEAHLIGYTGDLYDEPITLEFFERVRDLVRFEDLDALVDAISADVERATAIARRHGAPWREGEPVFELNPAIAIGRTISHALGMDTDLGPDVLDDGRPVVTDPVALSVAEASVAGLSARDAYSQTDEEWMTIVEPRRLSGILADAGSSAAIITAPLVAAGIPFAWDPYPPEEMPSFRPYYGVFDRPFSLMVPASRVAEAQEVMDAASSSATTSDVEVREVRSVKDGVVEVRRVEIHRGGTARVPVQPIEPQTPEDARRSHVVRLATWMVVLGIFVVYVGSRWAR